MERMRLKQFFLADSDKNETQTVYFKGRKQKLSGEKPGTDPKWKVTSKFKHMGNSNNAGQTFIIGWVWPPPRSFL